MNGLSDRVQAILLMVSSTLVGFGSANIVNGTTDIGIILIILGIIGNGIKEALGTKSETKSVT